MWADQDAFESVISYMRMELMISHKLVMPVENVFSPYEGQGVSV